MTLIAKAKYTLAIDLGEKLMIPDVAERTAELAEFCNRYHVARLDLYGKAAIAEQRTDEIVLSFLVDFQPEIPDGAYADSYFGLLESLEELFGPPVKLTTTYALATNPFSRPIDEATKVKVYGA